MKNIVFSAVFVLGIAFANAQSFAYQITEGTVPGNKNVISYTANVIGADEDLVMYNWQKFVNQQDGETYLVKSGEGNFEFESEHVAFPALDGEIVTLHSRFAPNDDKTGVALTIWIEKNDGTFYSMEESKRTGSNIKEWLRLFNQKVMDMNRTQRW